MFGILAQQSSGGPGPNTEVARKSLGSRLLAADFDLIDMDCSGMKNHAHYSASGLAASHAPSTKQAVQFVYRLE